MILLTNLIFPHLFNQIHKTNYKSLGYLFLFIIEHASLETSKSVMQTYV